MGLDQRGAADRDRKLKPYVPPDEAKPERGHKRGQQKTKGHDRSDDSSDLRGIPVVGLGGGAIAGTRPGDSAAALEQAGRDLVRGFLRRSRRRDYREAPG